QCTTSDSAVTRPDNPNSANTPAIAGRPASATHLGSPARGTRRLPAPELTAIVAPIACTASTPENARSALGVCSWVSTDEASWMTASEMAAISNGPPSADATIHRMTNQDPCGGGAAGAARGGRPTLARP